VKEITMRRYTLVSLPLFGIWLAAGVAFAGPPQTATLVVENMTCGTCPIVVKKALERVAGVSATTIDFDKKTATVTFDPDKASAARLIQATTEAGFPSQLIAKP
jgi:mercuric ion binding protein